MHNGKKLMRNDAHGLFQAKKNRPLQQAV